MSEKLTYEKLEKRVLELEKAEYERRKAEEALKVSEMHLRTLIRIIPDLLWVKDLQGIYLYCNSRFESYFGAKYKDIIGKTDYDFIDKHLADFFRKQDKEVLANGKPGRNEKEVHFADDGHRETLETITTPIHSNDGQLAGVLGIGRDITERKNAEETLARRSEFERLISHISSEFVGLSSDEIDAGIERALASVGAFTGADRAYVFVFHHGEELVKNTHEWCAKGVQPKIENFKQINVSESLPWFAEQIRKHAILDFHVPDVANLPPEAQFERERFEIQGIKSLIVVPMKLGDRLVGFLGFDTLSKCQTWTDNDRSLLRLVGETFTNAIERKRAEKEQENLQAKLSSAIEMAHLGPWEYDFANDLFTFNDHFYKIFHTTASQVTGYTMSPAEFAQRFVYPDDINFVWEEISNGVEVTDPTFSRKLEHRMLYPDGAVGYISVRYSIIRDSSGKKVKAYGVIQDITERKRAEERLRESEEKLSRSRKMESLGLLAGGVAHDLNNVLSGIVSYPELLLLDLPENSKSRKPLEIIQESGNKAVSIVSELLTIARGVASTKETLNLNDIAREYLASPEFAKLEQFHPAVIIKTDFDTELFNIGGSLVHIRKVIMNLVSNAA
ncbi:MAG: PAS domain S-box protein, partial [Proteobacteria bacterium]|nr:PAS domain S-box protein [Pseudomonadota bacterium]